MYLIVSFSITVRAVEQILIALLQNKISLCCCDFSSTCGKIQYDQMPTEQQLLFPSAPRSVPQRVVRIEKNLNSLGFFSPTASTGKRKQDKVVTFSRELPGGIRTEATATILGTSRGLPNTADLDKYLAFQFIVADLKKRCGTLSNPIGFTTYQLLRVLGLKPTGKRYAEVDQWLDRMAGTLIKSEGAVYFAKTKRYMRDRFHVFDKAYTVGEELPDGRKAEQNYVFLSDWQLENLNHGYVLPITLEHYQQLRSDIAKNLVPLLYIWFYASRQPFQKRYRDLCQQLNIKTWMHFSRAKEQFSPALNELQQIGYLTEWDLCPTMDGLDFKLVLTPGLIFRDQVKQMLVRQRDDSSGHAEAFDIHVSLLVDRGVNEKAARRLLFGIPQGADLKEQIEWIDSIIARNPRSFNNPPGLYVSLIRDGITPPATFISSRRRKELERLEYERSTAEACRAAAQYEIEIRYAEYREEQANTYIERLSAEARSRLSKEARKAAARHLQHFDVLSTEQQQELAYRFALRLILDELTLLTKEEFQSREQFQQLSLRSPEGR
jgi:Replication initiator protein A